MAAGSNAGFSSPLCPRAVLPGALCFAILLPFPCFAQQVPVPAPSRPVIRSTSELVKIEASVLDPRGNFVGGFEQRHFRVLDGSAEQPILYFAPVEAPAQILVMVETSPAVYLIRHEHLFAAYALLDGLAPEDQVALFSYDQSPRALLPFTADKSALAAALGQVQYTLGSAELNFYDSVASALDWLASVPGKKALVLLTTGLDSSPPARWDALVAKLRASDAVIYSVALGGSLSGAAGRKGKAAKKSPNAASQRDASTGDSNPLSFAKAGEALTSLAAISGGRAWFPSSAADFVPAYRAIASALRHQYVLGIAPAHDAQFHSLTVQLLDDAGRPRPTAAARAAAVATSGRAAASKSAEFTLFFRQGYLAPAPP